MKDILVLQYNVNKLSVDDVRRKFLRLKKDLAMEDDIPFIALPDGMSLMTCSLDTLKEVQTELNDIIEALEKAQHDS